MAAFAPPDGYRKLECVQERVRDALFLASRDEDDQKVALRVLLASDRRPCDPARARHELAMLAQLAGAGIPRVLEAWPTHDPPVIALERLPATSLDQWCEQSGRVEPGAFLEVALQLCAVVDRAHRAHLIHGDVCSANVRVEPATLQTFLVACDSAEPFEAAPSPDSPWLRHAESLEDLMYLAPERTGRMNRRHDFRSDLYALGCVFYRVLCGRPPFLGDDALALVHAHIARVPPRVDELRPDLPRTLSVLIDKLLAKDPEGRYQSAEALYGDLEACLLELRERGEIGPAFELGGAEVSRSPCFSTQLYGREAELGRLIDAHADCVRGVTRVVLLAGDTGSGKTALLDALTRNLRERGSRVARGSFESSRARPYAGWSSAVASIVEQILLESDAGLRRWRSALAEALGNVAAALVELVPDLGIVLGEVPEIPRLSPAATRARLSLALQRFVRACALPEQPLVLVLDDLHWSDSGSWGLLEEILADSEDRPLLVVGAYRDCAVSGAEADDDVSFASRVASWREALDGLEIVRLGALTPAAVDLMVADALRRDPADVTGLRDILERKTGYSPLLIRQFIEHISERGLLRHRSGSGWIWDESELAAADVPDEAVALMTARLERLGSDARLVIGVASCVGDAFDMASLLPLLELEPRACQQALGDLVATGLIAPGARGHRFVHARVREAAYGELEPGERADLHARLGCVLIDELPEDGSAEQLLAAVDHLNLGQGSELSLPREVLIDANLRAARSALESGSSVTGWRHLTVARSLLDERDWRERRALALEVMLASSECARELGRSQEALELVESVARRGLDPSERFRSAIQRLRILPLLEPPEVCVASALALLRELGVRWPARPSYRRAHWVLRVSGWLVALRGARAMLRPADGRASAATAILLVLAVSGPSMLLHDVRLAALASSLAVRLQARFGRLTSPAYRYATFTAFSYVLIGRPELARRRTALALEWNDRIRDPLLGFRTEHVVYALILPWLEPRRRMLEPLRRVAESVREVGDPEYFQYARFMVGLYRALVGDPIADVEPRLAHLAESSQRSRPWYVEGRECHAAYALLVHLPSVANLRELVAASRSELRGDAPYLSTMWMLVLCFFGEHELAFEESERIGERLHLSCPFVHVADHVFYRGVAAGRLAAQGTGAWRRRYRAALADSASRMRAWARGGPDFVHMALLLDAERARVARRVTRASALYEAAARAAERQGYPHHAALAYEYRAELLIEARRGMGARHARIEAARCYQSWGATAKAASLLRIG